MEHADPVLPSQLMMQVQSAAPDVTRLLRTLGEPLTESYFTGFINRYGAGRAYELAFGSKKLLSNFSSAWTAAKAGAWELFELLMLEHWLGRHPAEIVRALPAGTGLATLLHESRETVAVALYARAKDLNWREPLTFVRALNVSESYMRAVLENSDLIRDTDRPLFQRRLGSCIVLRSRQEDVAREDLELAERCLEDSLSAPSNRPEGAAVYLYESRLRLFDVTGDVETLRKNTRPLASMSQSVVAPVLAETWIRLAAIASSEASRKICLQRAEAALGEADESDVVAAMKCVAVRGLARFLAHEPISTTLNLNGMRLPFGLKAAGRAWVIEEHATGQAALRGLIREFESCDPTIAAHPLCRRVHASLLSALAGTVKKNGSRGALLTRATVIRQGRGPQRTLRDPESLLENAIDLFALASLGETPDARTRALLATLTLVDFDQAWATPLLVLAQHLEQFGELTLNTAYEVRQHPMTDRALLQAVLRADSSLLYKAAAERALESREIDRQILGGRSGAFMAADYSGIIDETFVFKPTLSALSDREDVRGTRLAGIIARRGLQRRFSVAETLASSAIPEDDPLRHRNCEVLVARRFHHGQLLADRAARASQGELSVLLDSAVEFLALIHASEHVATPTDAPGGFRDLRKKELGRWLRDGVRLEDHLQIFNRWRAGFIGQPMLPRRDAHASNWLVTQAGGIVALDLEACGLRPLGYELAQLLEDAFLLPLSEGGWAERRRLMRLYCRRLRAEGVVTRPETAWHCYELSALARAIGRLTDPLSPPGQRKSAEALMSDLAARTGDRGIRDICYDVTVAWKARLGTTTVAGADLTAGRRRHLSRAMSFELRHGEVVLLDRSGWAYMAAVADALNRAGLNTNKAELAAVAGAVDEKRFEMHDNGRRVRARYGHTRPVDINYPVVTGDKRVFHGTPSASLDAILEEGLQPRGRLWVHLSDNAAQAVLTAKRHGPGVLLALDYKPGRAVALHHAGGSTYLAASVMPNQLQILSALQEHNLGLG